MPEWRTGVRWIVKPEVPRSNPTGGNIFAAGIFLQVKPSEIKIGNFLY